MNQVDFAGGVLYGGANSLLNVGGAEQQVIAWFGVKPASRTKRSGRASSGKDT